MIMKHTKFVLKVMELVLCCQLVATKAVRSLKHVHYLRGVRFNTTLSTFAHV